MEVVSLRFTYKTYTECTALFCPVAELMTATYAYTANKQIQRLSGICLDYGNLSEGHLAADKAVSESSHLFAWIEPSFSF